MFYRFSLETDVKLGEIAELCPNFVTGADLYSISANAWFTAVRKTITNIEAGILRKLYIYFFVLVIVYF